MENVLREAQRQIDELDACCARMRDVAQIAIGLFERRHLPADAEHLRRLLTRAEASADELAAQEPSAKCPPGGRGHAAV